MVLKLHPYQEKLLKTISRNSQGELYLFTGRQMGKSVIQQFWQDAIDQSLKDIILDSGTVFGYQYYTAQPVGGDWASMTNWCKQTFGEPTDIWINEEFMWPENGRWIMNNSKFWFRDESDRTMFILKWR